MRFGIVAVLVFAAWLSTVHVAAGRAAGPPDCPAQPRIPERPADIRGFSFVGRATSARADRPFPQLVTYQFRVTDAIAGDIGPEVDIVGNVCDGLELDVGSTYLFSWKIPANDDSPYPVGSTMVVWEIDGTQVKLVGIEAPPGGYPPVFRKATTLGAALSIVAPGIHLPDTSRETLDHDSWWAWSVVAVAVAGATWRFVRRLDRLHLAVARESGRSVLMAPDGRDRDRFKASRPA
jgi:hypothetical protein